MEATDGNLFFSKLPQTSETEKGNRLGVLVKGGGHILCLEVILLLWNSTFSHLPVWV